MASIVEYDEDNVTHNLAIASGKAEVQLATVTRVRRAYWLGGHCLFDGPSPYTHRHFPYVPFWGFREDNTGVPYGYVRGMKYAQDSLNSSISKLRWGMSVTRIERTKGAVDMTDAQLRRQVARPDANIVLNASKMAEPGARFDVKRDYNLTDQHYQMLNDNRSTIQRVSAVTSGFMGKEGTARSGLQEQTQVEQSNQSLASVMDNFRFGRSLVGELLLAMIIADMGNKTQSIVITGDAIRPERTVVINKPEVDEQGYPYLSNDLQRTRLKVALEDVPSTNSYRGQQLNAMSEAVKSMPPQYQAAVLPFLVSLMDVPFKQEVVEAIRAVDQQQTPEAFNEAVQKGIEEAMVKAAHDLKLRELELKERVAESEIKGLDAKAVQIGVQAAFSAMQGGAQVAQMPMIAPIADEIMKGAGYQRPNPMGDDPNFPMPQNVPIPTGQPALTDVHKNTSPTFPPVPSDGPSPMHGIETVDTADNLSGKD